jgi:phenylacetate-CoA ligase
VIAEEVKPARYVFDPYYGYTEQIPIADNKNLIVGTGFLNLTMPFIRYKTDDSCTPVQKHFIIEGKRSSTIGLVGINDEFLPSTAFDLENPVFRNILTYQLVQEEKGKADLLLIPGAEFKDSDLPLITNQINKATRGIIDI